MKLTYYLYNCIPGAHAAWTVACLAVNQLDADKTVKAHWHGGKRAGSVLSGMVKADCGDISALAQSELRNRNQFTP